jgi:carboxyl-terminal processing protease
LPGFVTVFGKILRYTAGVMMIVISLWAGVLLAHRQAVAARAQAGLIEVRSPDAGRGGTLATTYETVDADVFWTVWDAIRDTHLEGAGDKQQLIFGAVNGLLQVGFEDPFSSFLPPAINRIAAANLEGSFGGVGVELAQQNDQLTVVAPIADTPGARAGLQPGDHVTRIDGVETNGQTVLEAVQQIRGDAGSEVVLSIERFAEDGSVSTFETTITRDNIDLKSVRLVSFEDGVAHVWVTGFALDTATEWDAVVETLVAGGVRSVILDLRNNAGGAVTAVPHIVGEFVPEGVVVTHDFGTRSQETGVAGEGALYDVPLVVLINRGTASAAEMVAGALQDRGRAPLIGQNSFGKGVIQEVLDVHLPGEETSASLRLVTAKWFTPDGHNVTSIGLRPDVRTPLRAGDGDAALIRARETLLSGRD